MVTLRAIQEQVSSAYDRLDMPSWPNPHPDMAATTREEEYSRVTDPGRYVVVHARVREWVGALAEIARVEQVREEGAIRSVRLTPSFPDTLALTLSECETAREDGTLASVRVRVAGIDLLTLPDCGCDACDFGSLDLIEAIDTTIGDIITGSIVVLRGPGWSAYWQSSGRMASSMGQIDDLRAICERLADGQDVPLPPGTESFTGRPWLR